MKRLLIIFIIAIQFLNYFFQNVESKKKEKLNVLFIAVDNLCLQLGMYGQSQMLIERKRA